MRVMGGVILFRMLHVVMVAVAESLFTCGGVCVDEKVPLIANMEEEPADKEEDIPVIKDLEDEPEEVEEDVPVIKNIGNEPEEIEEDVPVIKNMGDESEETEEDVPVIKNVEEKPEEVDEEESHEVPQVCACMCTCKHVCMCVYTNVCIRVWTIAPPPPLPCPSPQDDQYSLLREEVTALKLDNHDLKAAKQRLERQVKDTEEEVASLRVEKSALQKEVRGGVDWEDGSAHMHARTHTHQLWRSFCATFTNTIACFDVHE